MLDFLRLRNFQSHRDTRLDFVPGVNVITAEPESDLRNNIGKTAILRGLELAVGNRPLGGRFFSDFAGDRGATEIDLGVDGSVVSLTKDVAVKDGKKTVRRSGYSMDGEECRDDYGAMKGGVPDRIRDLLNLSDLNVQDQLDGPFLICSTPGEVARAFNRVTKLEKVDEWVSGLTTRVNAANQETETLERQLLEKRADLEQYGDLPDIEREVREAEMLQDRMEACTENHAKVSGMVEDLDGIKERAKRWDRVAAVGDEVDESLGLLEAVRQKDLRIGLISAQVGRLEAIEPLTERYERIGGAEIPLKKARDSHGDVAKRTEEIRRVERIAEDLDSLDGQIEERGRREDALVSDYVAVLRELGRCPTCFTRVDEETLDRIVGMV